MPEQTRASMRVIADSCDSCLSSEVACIHIVGAVNKSICVDCLRYMNGLFALHIKRGGSDATP